MSQAASDRVIWTNADLEFFPDNGDRYEIIDGELFVTRSPHYRHQQTFGRIFAALDTWSKSTGLGAAIPEAGVIFSETNSVIPDVVWVSKGRLDTLLDEAGHLTGAPELVVEVLSSGQSNEKRDREIKLKLYSVRGVSEYWIVDWQLKQITVYRRENAQLKLAATLLTGDRLSSPLLPGFSAQLEQLLS